MWKAWEVPQVSSRLLLFGISVVSIAFYWLTMLIDEFDDACMLSVQLRRHTSRVWSPEKSPLIVYVTEIRNVLLKLTGIDREIVSVAYLVLRVCDR